MQDIRDSIRKMISISDLELDNLLSRCNSQSFKRMQALSLPGKVPNEVFFVEQGLVRVMIAGADGTEHTMYFAMEGQFIAAYAGFILQQPSLYTLQALEQTHVVVMPREAVEWGYTNLTEGQKMGRLIAEYYFIYQDEHIKRFYATTPRQRYDTITQLFQNIHNRVPQHMIASYLGITPVHLSRIKKENG